MNIPPNWLKNGNSLVFWRDENEDLGHVGIDVIISLSVKEPIGKNDLASWPAGHVFPTMVHCLDKDDKF